jgi:hypothetical protein
MVAGKRRADLYRLAGAAVLAIFAALYALSRLGTSGNETSRFATIQAVAEQNTFAIEKTDFFTVDHVKYNGHVYSDKPLWLPTMIGVALKPVRYVTKWTFRNDREKLVYLVNLVVGGAVNILLFWWLFNLFRQLPHGTLEAKFLLALGSIMGSWLLSYSVVLNNHTPAALCVLGAYVALRKYSRRPTYRAAVLAALSCGILGALEIPGGVIFGLTLLPALWFSAPKEKSVEHLLAAACVLGISALFVFSLNRFAYGHPLPLYMVKGGSFQPGTQGKSPLGYAAECLLGCRGVFSYQPFLLLAFPALWFCRKKLRTADWCVIAATLVFTLFYLVITNEYGGAAYGFRYLVPVIPVWSFLAGRLVLEIPKRKARIALGAVAALLLVWGVVTSAVGAYFPFCYAFEGDRTPVGHFSRSVRSTFGGNLLNWSYEHYPESALTGALVRHYGERAALMHLFWSFVNMGKLDLKEVIDFYLPKDIAAGRFVPRTNPIALDELRAWLGFRMNALSNDELGAWVAYARERGIEKASKQ